MNMTLEWPLKRIAIPNVTDKRREEEKTCGTCVSVPWPFFFSVFFYLHFYFFMRASVSWAEFIDSDRNNKGKTSLVQSKIRPMNWERSERNPFVDEAMCNLIYYYYFFFAGWTHWPIESTPEFSRRSILWWINWARTFGTRWASGTDRSVHLLLVIRTRRWPLRQPILRRQTATVLSDMKNESCFP